MRIAMALLALALAAGCKKKETKPAETTGSGSAVVAADAAEMGSAVAGSGSDVGSAAVQAGSGSDAAPQMAKKAGNCPSTVFGANTKAELKGKDIIVTVTSADKDAIAAIQKRTDELLAEKKDGAGSAAGGHDQKGTHGGGAGICPVFVPEGAATKVKKEKNGVAVTITPKDKLEGLKIEIDGRITKANNWVKDNITPGDKGNQGGVGGGKGEHGANHSGEGDSKGVERKKGGGGGGTGGGGGDTGGGGGKGTGGGTGGGGGKGSGSAAK